MKKLATFLLLIAFMVPFSTIAAPQSGGNRGASSEGKERVREITELRQLNSETYLLEDGSYECEISAENKYFYDPEGQLKLIENSLVENEKVIDGKQFDYSNKANDLTAYFSGSSADAMIEYRGSALSFHPAVRGSSGASFDLAGLPEVCEEFGLTGDNCVLYSNAFSNADLIYAVKNNGLTGAVLIRPGSGGGSYAFTFDTGGYSVSAEGNKLRFSSIEGEAEFDFELYSVRYGGADHSGSVNCSVSYPTDDSVTVTIPIDGDSIGNLRTPEPVLIEMTLTITGSSNTYDSYVASKNPTTNYGSSTLLKTGKDNSCYVRRSYIKFVINAAIDSDNVISACIKLKKNGTTTPTIKAYRVTGSWHQNSITWDNKPTNASQSASGTAAALSDNWYGMYVTNVVKKFISGTYTNWGFMIKDDTENDSTHYSSFRSSDYDSNKPKLIINYYIPVYCGSRTYKATSWNINCMAFALEFPYSINPYNNNSELIGMTQTQMLNYVKAATDAWLLDSSNVGINNFQELDYYYSNIPIGWYRVALRVGFNDTNGNGICDGISEYPGSHWWFQTSTGQWAEKQGFSPSQLVAGSTGVDPATLNWTYSSYVFDSDIIYYAIKDIREVDW